jgi:hypothetical protein
MELLSSEAGNSMASAISRGTPIGVLMNIRRTKVTRPNGAERALRPRAAHHQRTGVGRGR